MSMFFVKDGEPFIPEGINPDLAKIVKAVVKTCRLTLKAQMKTNGLINAANSGNADQMKEIALKCIERNRIGYNADMALTGVKVGEVDDAFFADKDEEFWKSLLEVLVDMGYIRTVVDARALSIVGGALEKVLGIKLNEINFFVNQAEILDEDEVVAAAEAEAAENAEAEEVAEEATEEAAPAEE